MYNMLLQQFYQFRFSSLTTKIIISQVITIQCGFRSLL